MKKLTLSLILCLLCILLCSCSIYNNENSDNDYFASDICEENQPESLPHIEIIKETDIRCDQIMYLSEDLAVVYADTSFKIVDIEGNMKNGSYSIVYPFNDGKAIAATKDNPNEYIYIDKNGELISKVDDIRIITRNTEIYSINKDGKEYMGLQNTSGEKLTEPIFEYINPANREYNFAILMDNSKKVLISSKGEILHYLPDDILSAYKTSESSPIVVGLNNSYALMDNDGNIISSYFDSVGEFSNDIAVVTKEGKIGVINNKGEILIEPYLGSDNNNVNIFNNKIAFLTNNNTLSFARIVYENKEGA